MSREKQILDKAETTGRGWEKIKMDSWGREDLSWSLSDGYGERGREGCYG